MYGAMTCVFFRTHPMSRHFVHKCLPARSFFQLRFFFPYGYERASQFLSHYGEGSMSFVRLVLGGMCPIFPRPNTTTWQMCAADRGAICRGCPQGPPQEMPQYRSQEHGQQSPTTLRAQTYLQANKLTCFPSETSEFSQPTRWSQPTSYIGKDNVISSGDSFRMRVADKDNEVCTFIGPAIHTAMPKMPWCAGYKAEVSSITISDTWERPPSAESCTRSALSSGSP